VTVPVSCAKEGAGTAVRMNINVIIDAAIRFIILRLLS
jgi:aspartate ammonia-lyase